MKFFFTYFIIVILLVSNQADFVIYPCKNTNWSSITFRIPIETPTKVFWPICKEGSNIYCLSAFETYVENLEQAVEFSNLVEVGVMHTSLDSFEKYEKIGENAAIASHDAFQPMYLRHNFFVERSGCCLGQQFSYYKHGFNPLKVTPLQYISKLTNYTVQNKNLNQVWAFYMHECDVNVIIKLGFGQGELKRIPRTEDRLGQHRPGKPYRLKIGDSWSPDIPYENPGDFLTFEWFKTNVMCLDQPWICEAENDFVKL